MSTLRAVRIGTLVCLSAAIAACDTTADKQRKADQQQAEANEKTQMAREQAQQQGARAENSAQQEATQEQRKADQAENAAFAELGKEEGDYALRLNDAIDDLAGKSKDLRTAAAAEKDAKRQTDDNRVLDEVTEHRDALLADAKSVPYATTRSWPDLKNRIDRDLEDVDPVARSAAAHIKSSPR
jgi:hypothetical protein